MRIYKYTAISFTTQCRTESMKYHQSKCYLPPRPFPVPPLPTGNGSEACRTGTDCCLLNNSVPALTPGSEFATSQDWVCWCKVDPKGVVMLVDWLRLGGDDNVVVLVFDGLLPSECT